MPIDQKHITWAHLRRGQQPLKAEAYIALNGTPQAARSIPLIGPFFQQELPSFARHSKLKMARRGIQEALLHLPQFDLQHFVKFFALQRAKHHDCIEPVHELRRKLPPRCFHRRPLHLLVQVRYRLVFRLDKSHSPRHQLLDLPPPPVRPQNHHPLRQIPPPAVPHRHPPFFPPPPPPPPHPPPTLLTLLH